MDGTVCRIMATVHTVASRRRRSAILVVINTFPPSYFLHPLSIEWEKPPQVVNHQIKHVYVSVTPICQSRFPGLVILKFLLSLVCCEYHQDQDTPGKVIVGLIRHLAVFQVSVVWGAVFGR